MKTLTIVASLFAVLSGLILTDAAFAGTNKPGVLPCKRGIVYVCQ